MRMVRWIALLALAAVAFAAVAGGLRRGGPARAADDAARQRGVPERRRQGPLPRPRRRAGARGRGRGRASRWPAPRLRVFVDGKQRRQLRINRFGNGSLNLQQRTAARASRPSRPAPRCAFAPRAARWSSPAASRRLASQAPCQAPGRPAGSRSPRRRRARHGARHALCRGPRWWRTQRGATKVSGIGEEPRWPSHEDHAARASRESRPADGRGARCRRRSRVRARAPRPVVQSCACPASARARRPPPWSSSGSAPTRCATRRSSRTSSGWYQRAVAVAGIDPIDRPTIDWDDGARRGRAVRVRGRGRGQAEARGEVATRAWTASGSRPRCPARRSTASSSGCACRWPSWCRSSAGRRRATSRSSTSPARSTAPSSRAARAPTTASSWAAAGCCPTSSAASRA